MLCYIDLTKLYLQQLWKYIYFKIHIKIKDIILAIELLFLKVVYIKAPAGKISIGPTNKSHILSPKNDKSVSNTIKFKMQQRF